MGNWSVGSANQIGQQTAIDYAVRTNVERSYTSSTDSPRRNDTVSAPNDRSSTSASGKASSSYSFLSGPSKPVSLAEIEALIRRGGVSSTGLLVASVGAPVGIGGHLAARGGAKSGAAQTTPAGPARAVLVAGSPALTSGVARAKAAPPSGDTPKSALSIGSRAIAVAGAALVSNPGLAAAVAKMAAPPVAPAPPPPGAAKAAAKKVPNND